MEDIENIIEKMTLEEKVALCSGQDFWHTKQYPQYNIPKITMADGPHGIRKQVNVDDMLGINRSLPATCFPSESLTGCSFDPDLLEKIGEAIGIEASDQDVDIVLGPGVNIQRNPLCGRNFEYYSEDPYLSGKMAAAQIKGIEKSGTAACVKHFACNSQEYKRFSSSSILDERTLREIYLAGFETAVKEGKPSLVMSAYNKINGVYCSSNKKLLTDILRKEWGFDGAVVTDWGGLSDRIKAFEAGCDIAMPGGSAYMEKEAIEAVRSGKLDEKLIDESVRRILKLAFRNKEKKKADYDKHYQLAKQSAASSMVLLKNEDQILPLKREDKIALIGKMAKETRYQGSGSSHINPYRFSSIIDAFKDIDYLEDDDLDNLIGGLED